MPPFETNKYATAAWGNSSEDNAPGGTFGKLFGNQGGNIDQNKISFWLKELFYLLTGSKRTTFSQNINNFTVMPSYSSADLRFPSMTDNSGKNLYMDWSNTYLCGHTPFDYVYSPKNINEEHVSVTQQGSEWFESEVRCARANLPILFNPVINGSPNLCTTQPYSVSFCQPGNHSIVWAIANTNIATISGSGDQINLMSHSNGTTNLTATITYPCTYNVSMPSIILTKQITVGPPIVNIAYSMNGPCNGSYRTWSLNATSPNTVTSWLWTVDNPSSGSWYIYSPNSPSTFVDVSGGGGISVTGTNTCGSTKTGVTIYSNCPQSPITATPNPTTDEVNIAIAQSNDATSANKKKTMIYRIKVADELGNLKKQYKYSSGVSNAVINLSGLIKGTYIIQAFDGTSWSSVKVIKQ